MQTACADLAATLIALEHAALERWGNGDPGGFLELSDADVTYFDPFLDRRLDGLDALTAYYEQLRGKRRIARFELLHPRVQSCGELAVLTFNFVSWGGKQGESRWNCTEVFRRRADGTWKIIQTHWSMTRPERKQQGSV